MNSKVGYFGKFGGRYVPETLYSALVELESAYNELQKDKKFLDELNFYLEKYAGRPTPLTLAENLSKKLGVGKIYLKREDLCHTGSHKINNTIGQALLAKKLNKKRVIAETGAGQHGLATATACALFGLECVIYMGEKDIARQEINVFKMKLLGAEVVSVRSGSKTLKDAINESLRDWVTNVRTTYYLLGSVVGPHPYPTIVRDFQSIIGKETKQQILKVEKRLPHKLIACVGGGSNSIGLFHPFFKDKDVEFIGVEASGCASLSKGRLGVLHGAATYILQDKFGQIKTTHSIAAGLDYPAVGPQHSHYKSINRAIYVSVTDTEAINGFKLLSQTEGIIPALEPAHALGFLPKLQKNENQIIVVCLSGRGDKDIYQMKKYLKNDRKDFSK